jgi:hypothetical protein
MSAELVLTNDLSSEVVRAESAEAELSADISEEAARALSAETSLGERVGELEPVQFLGATTVGAGSTAGIDPLLAAWISAHAAGPGVYYAMFSVMAAGSIGGMIQDVRVAGSWDGTAVTVDDVMVFNKKYMGAASVLDADVLTDGTFSVDQGAENVGFNWMVERIKISFVAA